MFENLHSDSKPVFVFLSVFLVSGLGDGVWGHDSISTVTLKEWNHVYDRLLKATQTVSLRSPGILPGRNLCLYYFTILRLPLVLQHHLFS